MKSKYIILLFAILLAFKLNAQTLWVGIQTNKYQYKVPKMQDYVRKYTTDRNFNVTLGFEFKKWAVYANAGKQKNTLTENYTADDLSSWEIEKEKKVRTQNYLGFGIGSQIFNCSKFKLLYLSGAQVNKSVETYYWRQAVNKSTKEFKFNDKDLKLNICLKQEIIGSYEIFKGLGILANIGIVNNLIPYDELNEMNIIKNDFRWGYYISAGMIYSMHLSKKK
jgi:hypothetical protein